MAKSVRLVLGPALLLVSAIIGCAPPDKGDEQTTRTRSALTGSLFQPYVTYPTGSWPQAVAIGDLDGDGRNDVALLTSNYSDPTNDYMVHVFLQAPDGSLKPRVRYPVGMRSSSIDIGDVNGDGRADVVVGIANGNGIKIGVLLQNALGTLDPMVSYPSVNSYQVKIADLNGDGRMDVAGLSWGSYGDGVDVLLQNETGTLAAPVTYHAPHGGWDELDAGDIDGDGRTDLVVMSGQSFSPNVSVLLQTPDGTFGAPTSYSVGPNLLTHGVAVGDTNGDGRSDIVVSYGGNRPSSLIGRFLQNAQGGMDPAVSYPSYDIPSAVVLADMDNDGRKDVVVTHDGWNRVGVYRQTPAGDFHNEELYLAQTTNSTMPQGLAVGDINGDGRPDAVIADLTYGLVVLRHVDDVSLALSVTSPTGGPYYAGLPVTVRWTPGDNVTLAGFDVSASFDNGASYVPIAGCTGLPATARDCFWSSPGPANPSIRVRVTARDSAGQSVSAESTFNVVVPSITVTGPGAAAYVGAATAITWTHNLPADGTVRVELTRDGGGSYETLADAAPNTGTFNWTVTGPDSATARVRVTSNGSLVASGTGANFAIRTPVVTVTGPAVGATMIALSFSVTWTQNISTATTVRIELSRDGGSTFQTLAAAAPTGQSGGTFTGSAPGPDTTNALVRVTTNGSVTATGTSPSFNLVTPTVAITNPQAGGTSLVGTPLLIAWTTNLPATSSVRVELTRNGGSTFETLAAAAPNTGSFDWVVTGPATGAAAVRVTINGPGAPVATSGTFGIVTPSLTVSSPANATTLYAGAPTAISWSSNLPATDTVRIEFTNDGGSSFQTLAAAAPNSGSFTWNVNGPQTFGQVRVTSNGPAVASGMSGTFAIVTPVLTVTAPAPGDTVFTPWLPIAWTSNVASATTVRIELSLDGGATYQTLADAAPTGGLLGNFSGIAVPGTTNAQVRVTTNGPVTVTGTSGSFAMLTPTLTVTSPVAGATLYAGTPLTIGWSTNLPAASLMRIELSRDGGATFETLAAAAPNTGSFAWVITGPDSPAVSVRVTPTGPVIASATSGTLAIATPSLIVTGPAAGTLAYAGTPVTITWTDNLSASDPVTIELSRDGGATFETLAAAAPDTGSFVWTASGPDTAEARVRITSTGAASMSQLGAAFQIVTPTLVVSAPTAGASWAIGTARTISWSSNLPARTTVRVELSRDGGTSWTTLASAAPATGTLSWTATAPATTSALVRVSANGDVPSVGSSGPFAIGSPALAVTSPAGGASWTIGAAQAITWSTNLLPTTTVKIQLSRNGGSTYTTLASATPNTGSFAWTATGSASTTAIVRVSANGFTASGVSGVFSLVAGKVTVTSPNTAVTWTTGTVHAITWTHNAGLGAQFKIEISRSGIWSVIASAAPGGGVTSGSYNWTVAGAKTTNAKIRITWTGNTAANDTSDVAFKIN